jgi:hypothetical protein
MSVDAVCFGLSDSRETTRPVRYLVLNLSGSEGFFPSRVSLQGLQPLLFQSPSCHRRYERYHRTCTRHIAHLIAVLMCQLAVHVQHASSCSVLAIALRSGTGMPAAHM